MAQKKFEDITEEQLRRTFAGMSSGGAASAALRLADELTSGLIVLL